MRLRKTHLLLYNYATIIKFSSLSLYSQSLAVGWVKHCQTFDENLKETTKSATQRQFSNVGFRESFMQL